MLEYIQNTDRKPKPLFVMNEYYDVLELKEAPEIVKLLESEPSIRRKPLIKAIGLWTNNILRPKKRTERGGRIRNLISSLCPYHPFKPSSFHMYINGNFYCTVCKRRGDWIDLIICFYNPQSVEELLNEANLYILKNQKPHTQ